MSVNVYKNGTLQRLAGDQKLGTAAYTDSSDYDTSGSAADALKEAKAYTDDIIGEESTDTTEGSGILGRIGDIEEDINDIATDKDIESIFE